MPFVPDVKRNDVKGVLAWLGRELDADTFRPEMLQMARMLQDRPSDAYLPALEEWHATRAKEGKALPPVPPENDIEAPVFY